MKSGIIFFEDGDVVQFGQLTSLNKLARTVQETLAQLFEQERQQLLASITEDELKNIVEKKVKEIK